MHLIKKYANRKLYDTKTKRSITMDHIAELVDAAEEFTVIDNQTGEDITSNILSQLVGRSLQRHTQEVPLALLTGLLQKGSGEVLSYARKYVGFWQRVAKMAEGRIDDFEYLIDKGKNAADPDGGQEKNEIIPQNDELKKWIAELINEGIERSSKKKNAEIKREFSDLKKVIKELAAKIDRL